MSDELKKIILRVFLLAVISFGCINALANSQIDTRSAPSTQKLPQGFVRGDVVSYSYVPIRHWSTQQGIGILPYLFEYNLMAQKDGTPLESFHEENIRRIDIASRWSTAIMLYPRQPEYRDEIINLMLRCYKNRQLIILVDYHNHSTETSYQKVRAILEKLWLNRDKNLTNTEGDTATGQQLINNILTVKLGDEGLCGLGTKGLEKVYDDFNKRVRYWKQDDHTPFSHIRGWYNLISYTGLDYKGCYAAGRRDVEEHGRHVLPANTQAIGVDVYHYWFHRFSPFDPADLSVPREKVRAHTTEWHRLRTKYYPEGLEVRVCKNANDPATWLPECWNDTHAMLAAIELAGAKEAMMWFIGVSGQIDATGSKDIVTYTTPVETMELYYENLKAGPWVALSWWVFGNFKDMHGGLEYYDKKLMHYTPQSPEGVPYSDEMLDYWHNEYVKVKISMFNDVVYNQFAYLNGPKQKDNLEQSKEEKMEIKIKSSAFQHEGMIPSKYTCDGADISPPLQWDAVPEGTKSIALISDDPDAPMGTWVHWVLFNLPAEAGELPENVPPDKNLPGGAKQGTNDFRRIGYGGPCPPGGTHRYFFKIYALDTELDLPAGARKKELLKEMEGHILAEGRLIGKYKRR